MDIYRKILKVNESQSRTLMVHQNIKHFLMVVRKISLQERIRVKSDCAHLSIVE